MQPKKREVYNGNMLHITYWVNHKLHRDDGPASLHYKLIHGNKYLVSESWYQHDRMHRDNGPAMTKWKISGLRRYKFKEFYINHNNLHNENMPAFKKYTVVNNKSVLSHVEWYSNGVVSRIGGPAVIQYDTDGNIILEKWYLNGYLHRDDGPAVINYNSVVEWYSNSCLTNCCKITDCYTKILDHTLQQCTNYEPFIVKKIIKYLI